MTHAALNCGRCRKHLNAALFTQPGLSQPKLEMLISLIRDLRRDAGDFA